MINKHLLARINKRISFIYIEHAKISCKQKALIADTHDGIFIIPCGSLMTLLLGPGTSITHDAMSLIGDSGMCLVWISEHSFKTYAYGEPLISSDKLVLKQAKAIVTPRKHLEIARKMYQMRFPNDDFKGLSIAKMRSKEGTRMKQIYQKYADQYNIKWFGRKYDPQNYYASDPINQAITSANQMLYGICSAVILALGLSPALGFIHVGTNKALVYDISDLYKATISIPIAFKTVKEAGTDFYKVLRENMYDKIQAKDLLATIIHDIFVLLNIKQPDLIVKLSLWDNIQDLQKAGIQYQERR